MAKRVTLFLLLCAVAGVLLVHAHAGHDHDHDHDHAHAHAAVKKVATEATERRAPPPAEAAHGHHHDHDHREEAPAPDGANDHDHDHDDRDAHRTLKGSAAAPHKGHDHAHDHDHGHAHSHSRTPAPAAPAGSKKVATTDRFSVRIWSEALFATALVGAAPVLVLLFVPLGVGSQEAQKPLLRVFLSFAAGGLLGDALLHLLPHSIPNGHDHSHDHDHHDREDHDHGHEGHSHSLQDLSVWLWTIAGMMAFLMLEKFVRAQTVGGHGHSHSGGHSHGVRDTKKIDESTATARKRKAALNGEKELVDVVDQHKDDEHEHGHAKQPIAAAGYLNLAADFAHNFTDGLAIGATFLRGSGWSTTVAMLLHELPHEIGDFAILIQSGFTRREAMLTQLLTALGAMVGTVIGLLMEGAGDSSAAWISPFTAGGFIYIACASVMPELLEDCSLAQSLKEAAAMCLGIGLMILIALNE
ncbi:Zinc-iron permease [Globisporangium polare]